jgi:MHS family shikimate/dehydroshikimate transporter-like MFS transporter
LPPSASAFCFARWAGDLRPLRRPPRPQAHADAHRLDDGDRHRADWYSPSFASIGWWAPVLLVTLRAIQGFAVGGEWGGAALLSVESAPKHRKAFYSSGVQVGYGVGLLLSTGLVSLISQLTTDEQFLSWGWRIPFIFSIVLVIAALWIRNGMEESAEFENSSWKNRSPKSVCR